MSQEIFDAIDPSISGTALAGVLNDFKNAVVSGISGTTRPATLQAGGTWVDVTNDPTYWSFKMWTGAADIEVFRLYLDSSIASINNATTEFNVKRVSADTTGAILKLIKQRIATNGQVLDGDVVGEIRMVGRADDASNPVVAKIIFTSTDDETASAFGGTLSFQSVPDGLGVLTEHMRFIAGQVETVLPHKLNSLRLVSQDIATAATISQLSAAKVLAEMTGSTACSIQGINSAQDSQVVTVHNRSSAVVTLKHQDAGATAADRLKLPTSADYVLVPDASATLYYCTTDARWKLLSTADKSFNGYTINTYYGVTNTFTPTTTIVRVRAYRRRQGMEQEYSGFLDVFGNAYAWGPNGNGQLGLGDVTSRSSPVAVVGGQIFSRIYGSNRNQGVDQTNFGINTAGVLYAWGMNTNGQLGLGDVTPRSSPVAVLGGFKWLRAYPRDNHTFGINTSMVPYAWGMNANGELGVGDVTPRSSPVAILGGLTFAKLLAVSGSSATTVVGLTKAGIAYAWGNNSKGQVGVGDILARSSPVAVLGGLTFSDVVGLTVADQSFIGLTPAGLAYGWGGNANGQLGNGDNVARSSPVAVLGGLTFKRVYGHYQGGAFYGLTSAGTLYAWGTNSAGELGDGTLVGKSSPVLVLGGLTFAKVFPFRQCVFAMTAEGVVYSWGGNSGGILGLGDVVSRSSPVAILGGFTFTDIILPNPVSPDQFSVFAVQADGSLYAWGLNSQGILGDGTTTMKSSPVAVLGGIKADVTQPTYSADLTLVSGQPYTISINDGGIASFGNIPLGLNIGRVEVEYLQ